ncbi:hypothetical protein VSVS05_04459 (plasmid) [Vibrio scophthalmi]|uniref:DUF6094 domain-containing protein n=1 Tax=Vibrio scophthalmi TaxID=45658 RepID=A0A1C7FJK5_9VIBR|nr:hypothetical protein VSVS05_04459 [Vibrio scophthalmi]
MAIMHPRVAHNYLKDGYYPTDEATLSNIAKRLCLKAGTHRLLDPCCGEGKALTLLASAIEQAPQCLVHTYGVELDTERAIMASLTLDNVLRSNTFDTLIGAGSQSVLFFKPALWQYGHRPNGQCITFNGAVRGAIYSTLLADVKNGGSVGLGCPLPVTDTRIQSLLSAALALCASICGQYRPF